MQASRHQVNLWQGSTDVMSWKKLPVWNSTKKNSMALTNILSLAKTLKWLITVHDEMSCLKNVVTISVEKSQLKFKLYLSEVTNLMRREG